MKRPGAWTIALALGLAAALAPSGPAWGQLRAPDGVSVAVGGFDPGRKSDIPGLLDQLRDALPRMKAAGATSHEGYVRWNLIEPEPGAFDFSAYDPFVELYKEHGLKWVPFLIIGSPYSLPDWFYESDEKFGYVCLEHGEESDVQSLWSPHIRGHVERVIAAFAAHYRDSGVVESVLLGVTGNYGEAIYPASGNDWTADIHGQYHTHSGYWAGDAHARASFRDWLKKRYGSIEALNRAWRAGFAGFDEIQPALREAAPSNRAWVDFVEWYRESMNDYTEFWTETARRHFPDTPVYICTGGDANPEHGSDFTAQVKVAARHGAGVRITNEGSDYALNFTITRWVASAGRFYGAYYGFEPAGHVDERGVTARFFNAATSGAGQLHSYYPNVFGSPERLAAWTRDFPNFRPRRPTADVAMFYSKASRALGAGFYPQARELRDLFDYEIADETMIADGFLEGARLLVWPGGGVTENEAFAEIRQWIAAGGVLLYYASGGPMRAPDGTAPEGWPQALAAATDAEAIAKINRAAALRLTPEKTREKLVFPYGNGRLIFVPDPGDAGTLLGLGPIENIVRWLFAGKLGFEFRSAGAVDPAKDSVYFSVVDDGKTLMALSQSDARREKTILVNGKMLKVMTEPNRIVEMDLP